LTTSLKRFFASWNCQSGIAPSGSVKTGWSRFREQTREEAAPALCFREHLYPLAFRRKRDLL
jgi:hypothetical protein